MNQKVDYFAITEEDKLLMLDVLNEVFQMSDIRFHFGNITIQKIAELKCKLAHEGFCKRHGIERWEDMTDLDYEQEYREKWES